MIKYITECRAEWLGEADVGNQPPIEEAVYTALGTIDDLIWYNEIQRVDTLFQASYCTDRDYPLHAKRLQSIDIGPRWNLGGADSVAPAMSW